MYGHNPVPHNVQAHRLAKAGARLSVVHKVRWRGRLQDDEPGGRKPKVTRDKGIKRPAVVQVSDTSDEDIVPSARDRRKGKWQEPLELPDREPDYCTKLTSFGQCNQRSATGEN